MEEKAHGGKRRGAGRKPVTSKKKQITLYVEGKLIFPFGSEDKMKAKIYEFISGHTSTPEPLNDRTKSGLYAEFVQKQPIADEPLSFANNEKKLITQLVTPQVAAEAIMRKYVSDRRDCQADEDYLHWLSVLENDSRLSPKQKELVKNTR